MIAVPIEISARHIHLAKKDVEFLFGKGYKLKRMKGLSQRGEFAARETLTLENKGRKIEGVRVLGPVRKQTQVELAGTDAYRLGIKPPVRLSGDLRGAAKVSLIGPKGRLELISAAIIAKRHIHASGAQAKHYGLSDGQEVAVKIAGDRAVLLEKVAVRVKAGYAWNLHLDTDEANAAGIGRESVGELIKPDWWRKLLWR